MTEQNKIAGVVLAGGMARRMANQDKGLIEYAGRPLVDYAIKSLQSVTDEIGISANRNLDRYQQWNLPVIQDTTDTFMGPLAGVYAALDYFNADVLVVVPCDSPMFKAEHIVQLINRLSEKTNIVVASDGTHIHPVFMALNTGLKSSLEDYLAAQGRRVFEWVEKQSWGVVEFNEPVNVFTNINKPDDLQELEGRAGIIQPGLMN